MKNFKKIFVASLLIGFVVATQFANAAIRNPFNGSGSATGGTSRYVVASSGGDYTSLGAAVTAACAASPAGGTIFVKAGTYSQTSAIVGCTNLRITLDQSATIQVNGATVPTLFSASSGSGRIIIEGGKFLQTNGTLQGTAFDMSNLSNTWIKNTRIDSFGLAVLYSDTASTTFYNSISDVQLFDNNNCVEFSGTQANNNDLFNVRCRPKSGGGGIGIKLVDARGISIYGSNIEPSAAGTITGISIDATSREILVSGTWIEGNGTGVDIASGANRVTFIGSSITSNTTDVVDAGTNTQFINTNRTGALLSNFVSNIPNTINKIGLAITQADTTNNPAGASIINSGTGNSLYIDANGNTGTTAGSSGALFLDNTNNTGTGANFYTNGATVGSTGVLFAKVDNASATGGVARFDNDGTGAALKINQNGNTGTTTGTSGGLVVNNAGTGFGAQFYTNSGASSGSLVYIEADNASYDQATLKIKNVGTSGAAANIRLDGVAPQIEFVETDQSTPAGKYEIEVQGDQFFVNSRNAADNSFENMLVANREASTGFTTWNFKGGVSTPIRTMTTTGSVIGTDYTILCDATGGAVTMNLPAVANTTGMIIVMKKIDAGGNACTLDGNASETIDGATTKATSTQYGNFMIQSNGSAWYIIN